MKTMKIMKTLILLGGALALVTPAQAWIFVRRPIVVTPYVAPYAYPVVVAPTYYAAPAPVIVLPPPTPIGSIFYALPAGARSATINGAQYYVAGSTYYSPHFGPNGVYYEVVANPL
jgi:hypothetical protein